LVNSLAPGSAITTMLTTAISDRNIFTAIK
jgi:hypothetical protein